MQKAFPWFGTALIVAAAEEKKERKAPKLSCSSAMNAHAYSNQVRGPESRGGCRVFLGSDLFPFRKKNFLLPVGLPLETDQRPALLKSLKLSIFKNWCFAYGEHKNLKWLTFYDFLLFNGVSHVSLTGSDLRREVAWKRLNTCHRFIKFSALLGLRSLWLHFIQKAF